MVEPEQVQQAVQRQDPPLRRDGMAGALRLPLCDPAGDDDVAQIGRRRRRVRRRGDDSEEGKERTSVVRSTPRYVRFRCRIRASLTMATVTPPAARRGATRASHACSARWRRGLPSASTTETRNRGPLEESSAIWGQDRVPTPP
jgi:hypothetical protein